MPPDNLKTGDERYAAGGVSTNKKSRLKRGGTTHACTMYRVVADVAVVAVLLLSSLLLLR